MAEQPTADFVVNLFFHYVRRTAGVNGEDALRLAAGNCEEGAVDALKEGAIFLLETVLVGLIRGRGLLVSTPRAADAMTHVRIHVDRHIRLESAAKHAVQFEHARAAELTAAALVSLR